MKAVAGSMPTRSISRQADFCEINVEREFFFCNNLNIFYIRLDLIKLSNNSVYFYAILKEKIIKSFICKFITNLCDMRY